MDATNTLIEKNRLSATDHAIITCSREEKITGWDLRAEQTFGWTAEEACGEDFFHLLLPHSAQTTSKTSLTDIVSSREDEQDEQFSFYQDLQHKNGSVFGAHLLIFNVQNSESIIILLRDLRKQQAILDRINTSYEQQTILAEVRRISLQPLALQQLFEQILKYIFSLSSLQLQPYGAVFLKEAGTDTFSLKAKSGFTERAKLPCTRLATGLCRYAQSGQYGIFKIETCKGEKAENACCLDHPHGHYCIPLHKTEEVVGVLCLYTKQGKLPSEKTDDLIRSVGDIITVMVEAREMDIQLLSLMHDLRHSTNIIREEKKFSESIIQGLTHGLIVTDLEGNIRTYNSVAESILSPFSSTLSEKKLAIVVGEEAAAKLLDTTLSGTGKIERELTISPNREDKKIIGYSVVPRVDGLGREVGRIIAINDISELKYVRKEMEKMNRLATVAEIASAVAHEVRNPLAGIKIMAQSIEGQSVSPEEQSECLTRIIRQVDRLNSLLTEFFSYARPAEPQVCATPLSDIIADTQPLIANKMTKSHIVFENHCDEKLPPIVADPNQVQQVLLNLFLNAMDAISGGGKIEVGARLLKGARLTQHRRKHPGLLPHSVYIIAHITDDGAGMAPEVTEKVFEPFFTTKSTGTGLGLSIVYRTLRENDAVISVDSTPNKGTTFTIYFKAEQ